MRGGGDDFMDSLGIWLFGVGSSRFSVAVDGLVPMGCQVMAVALVYLTSIISSVIIVQEVGEWSKWRYLDWVISK